jgi:DNA-damage-inducible protein J
MAQANINIRLDEGLKQDFDSICNNLGLTMTAAFTVFAKTVVRRQRIPFDISLNVPNDETIAAIEEIQAMKKDLNRKLYSSFDELLQEVVADV